MGRELWGRLYPQLLSREWLIDQLITQGKSYRRLSRELGCSDKTIQKAAKFHGIRFPYVDVKNPTLRKALEKIPK